MSVKLETLTLIIYIQTALSLVVALYAMVKWTQRDAIVKLIGLYFFSGFLSNTISHALYIAGHGRKSNFVNAAYYITALGFILSIFYHAFGKKYKKIMITYFLCFLLFAIANALFIQQENINSISVFLDSITIILLCVLFFYKLMHDLPVAHIHRIPMFWFCAGFLIYRSGALFLFAFTTYLTHVLKDNLISYWVFHNILNIVEHLLVIVGLTYSLCELNAGKAAKTSAPL